MAHRTLDARPSAGSTVGTVFLHDDSYDIKMLSTTNSTEHQPAIADLGIFWAVLNEPPPGSIKTSRRHE